MFKVSKAAKEVLEEVIEPYGPSLDWESLQDFAERALERPGDAAFWDDDLYNTHTLMFHTPDWELTDEYIIDQANYRTALRLLTDEFPEDVEAATVGHWTYSRYECIKVRVLTDKGAIHPAFVRAMSFVVGLENYPVLDDEAYSELEYDVFSRTIDDVLAYDLPYDEEGYRIEFTDEQEAHFREYLHEHAYGYHEPGYISEEHIEEAVEFALNAESRQLHQDATLY